MKYISVCSGIEAASVAWEPLGWEPVAFSEIEPFPCAVLEYYYPGVRNMGDMTKYKEWDIEPGTINLLVGGTPCQSFSVAGLRKGLDDPRGNLTLTFLGLLDRFRPKWMVWENVPGILSHDRGRTFGTFLGALGQLGYGVAYRVLDAQYVRVESHARAVPQRRRRVFVVGCLGGWRSAAAVLLERESLCGYPPPRREAGEGIAPSLAARTKGGGGLGTDFDCDGGLIPGVANPLTRRMHKGINTTCDEGQTMVAHGIRTAQISSNGCGHIAFKESQSGCRVSDVHATLDANKGSRRMEGVVQVQWASGGGQLENPTAQAIRSGAEHNYQFLRTGMAVRRLTPRECERLQGFPDDYTLVPYRGKPASDSARYKALGNSMAVNVMRWIGERIEMASAITRMEA